MSRYFLIKYTQNYKLEYINTCPRQIFAKVSNVHCSRNIAYFNRYKHRSGQWLKLKCTIHVQQVGRNYTVGLHEKDFENNLFDNCIYLPWKRNVWSESVNNFMTQITVGLYVKNKFSLKPAFYALSYFEPLAISRFKMSNTARSSSFAKWSQYLFINLTNTCIGLL